MPSASTVPCFSFPWMGRIQQPALSCRRTAVHGDVVSAILASGTSGCAHVAHVAHTGLAASAGVHWPSLALTTFTGPGRMQAGRRAGIEGVVGHASLFGGWPRGKASHHVSSHDRRMDQRAPLAPAQLTEVCLDFWPHSGDMNASPSVSSVSSIEH